MLCGAKTRAGTPCKKYAMTNGSTKCRKHGGASLRGPENPQYVHGRRSKAYLENTRAARERVRELILLGRQWGVFNE